MVDQIIGPGPGGILVQAITAPLTIVLDSLFMPSALLLGALIVGPIATAAGVRAALWISDVIGLAAPLILQVSAVRRVWSLSTADVTR